MMNLSPLALATVLSISLSSVPPTHSATPLPGCHPPFSPHETYSPSSLVSFNSTNYQCVPEWSAHCSGSDNSPPGRPGTFASVAWTSLGDCDPSADPPTVTDPPTDAPTLPPTLSSYSDVDPGCPPPYSPAAASYRGGDLVSHDGRAYKCLGIEGSETGNWCAASAEYEPGVGKYWPTAWELMGTCVGSLAPTAAPTRDEGNFAGGCPAGYSKGAEYGPGSKVLVEGYVYQCKSYPYSAFCNIPLHEPGTKNGDLGWINLGWCAGSIVPTASPTRPSEDFVGGCPEEYRADVAYGAGDKVVKDGKVYQCQADRAAYCKETAFAPGTTAGSAAWTELGWCDGSLAPTASPTFDANAMGCPPEHVEGTEYRGGDKVAVGNMVYECSEEFAAFCPLRIPGKVPQDEAWVKMGPCTGTIAPTASPTFDPDTPGCPPEFVLGTPYEGGDKVTVGSIVYECSADAFSHCPNRTPGTLAEDEAWIKVGPCTGTIAPTSSPTFDPDTPGCPPAYVEGTVYVAGDKVTVGNFAYECTETYAKHCPYRSPNHVAGEEAWFKLGACTGTIAPTSSPTFDPNTPGCPEPYVAGTAYEDGDKVSIGSKVYLCEGDFAITCKQYGPEDHGGSQGWTKLGSCTGTIAPTSSPTFDPDTPGCPEPYDDTLAYIAGDKVSVENAVYECISGGNSAYCVVFGPTDNGGQLGWNKVGPCFGSLPPTASPTFSPDTPGCPPEHVAGTPYKGGDKVTVDGHVVYQCDELHQAHCPNRTPGALAGDESWVKLGVCTGTIAPTASPTVDPDSPGCPDDYSPATAYGKGDKVTVDGTTVYMCKLDDNAAFCNAGPMFAPGTGMHSDVAWVNMGSCLGTIAPTSAPTIDPEAPGCPTGYSAAAKYEGGDKVLVEGLVYMCKLDEYGAYCNAGPVYAPGGSNSDLGWIKMGSCQGTLAPVASPV
ncbi:hypothetical protein ACHAXS_003425 [Conticribra weissflogii]